ncbi:MAG: phytanoyl-CoA dioxygenase family protein [Gemmatimonadetes bacterium]|nr:phytanoyl-CoA dioxygenase family protein [Gemmatimonadota bacterium]
MNTDCLQHTLTEEEQTRFEGDGCFVLEKVMTAAQLAGITGAFDRMVAEACSGGQDAGERFTIRDVLWRDPLFLDLVDWPATLPKVWGILRWNIQVYHTVLMYSPSEPGKTEVDFLGWHQDSGQLNRDLEVSPRPRISIKVAFFLSDCSEPGRANFWAVPGSHLQDGLERPADGSAPAGAVPILVPAGSRPVRPPDLARLQHQHFRSCAQGPVLWIQLPLAAAAGRPERRGTVRPVRAGPEAAVGLFEKRGIRVHVAGGGGRSPEGVAAPACRRLGGRLKSTPTAA